MKPENILTVKYSLETGLIQAMTNIKGNAKLIFNKVCLILLSRRYLKQDKDTGIFTLK